MLLTVLSYIVDLAHLFLLIFPVLIYFIDFPKTLIIFYFCVCLYLTWYFMDDQCFLTLLSDKLAEMKEKKIFKRYLYYFYFYLMRIFNFEKNIKGFIKQYFCIDD